MNVIERVKAPTPKFFRILRTIGIALASAGGALLVVPAALPTGVIALAGYLTIAGTVMSAVSQAAVDPAAGSAYGQVTEYEDLP